MDSLLSPSKRQGRDLRTFLRILASNPNRLCGALPPVFASLPVVPTDPCEQWRYSYHQQAPSQLSITTVAGEPPFVKDDLGTTNSKRLRKLFVDDKNLAALVCYVVILATPLKIKRKDT